MMARVARRDGGFDAFEIDVARGRVDVDEHRPGADFEDHVGGGDPGQRRRDDLVAGADAGQAQGDFQRRRAGVEGAHRAAAAVFGERGLEGLHLRAAGDPARAQHVGDGGDGRLVDARSGERQEWLSHDLATSQTPMTMKPMPSSFWPASASPNQK